MLCNPTHTEQKEIEKSGSLAIVNVVFVVYYFLMCFPVCFLSFLFFFIAIYHTFYWNWVWTQDTCVLLFVMLKALHNSIRFFGPYHWRASMIAYSMEFCGAAAPALDYEWDFLQKAYILRFIFHLFGSSVSSTSRYPFLCTSLCLLFVIYSKHEQTFCDCDNFSRFSSHFFCLW